MSSVLDKIPTLSSTLAARICISTELWSLSNLLYALLPCSLCNFLTVWLPVLSDPFTLTFAWRDVLNKLSYSHSCMYHLPLGYSTGHVASAGCFCSCKYPACSSDRPLTSRRPKLKVYPPQMPVTALLVFLGSPRSHSGTHSFSLLSHP